MRKLFTLAIAGLMAAGTATAQDEMSAVWQQNPDHPVKSKGLADDPSTGYTYVASQKNMTVYDLDGKAMWHKDFTDIAPKLNKVDDIIPMWESGVIILADRKMGKDQLAGIDARTGQLLWITDRYQDVSEDNITYLKSEEAFIMGLKFGLIFVNARTGELRWQTDRFRGAAAKLTAPGDGYVVILNYKPKALGALFSGFKNQLVKIKLATGEIAWDVTYRGQLERKVVTREVLADLAVKDGAVVLQLNGMQVFDYANGEKKWSCAYDQTPGVIGANKGLAFLGGGSGRQTYGTVADPVIDGDFVYVLDFDGKRKQYIKKYERATGKMLWQSPDIDDARAVPNMFVRNGMIVLQVGGIVEVQEIRRERRSDGSTVTRYIVDFDEFGPYNLQGFDANTGKQVWQSDKLKKGITNTFMDGDNLIVCSGKALYSIDYQSGKEKYEVPLGKDNIGQASYVLPYKDKAIVVGEKGVSIHTVADGGLVKGTKYKKAVPVRIHGSMIFGNSLALRNGDGDYAVYNLDTGSYKKYDGRSSADALLSDDGLALYVWEDGGMMRKSKVTRFATR